MTRGKVLIGVVVVALILGGSVAAWLLTHRDPGATEPSSSSSAAKYHCPMHPMMVSDRPGDCPICGMRLVPMEESEPTEGVRRPHHADTPPKSPDNVAKYHCPMHPTMVSDHPGDCPICGMRLVRMEDSEKKEEEATSSDLADRATVRLSPAKQQLIGVKTGTVTRTPLKRSIRAVGRVTYDETRLRHIHTKIAGYVETLHANATGELVREGQPLLEIYSPELLASQQEYLIALEARSRMAASSIEGVALSVDDLVASGRRRLELFDLRDDQLRQLEASGKVQRTVTLYAPISGYILMRNVTQGERIEPGTTVLDLADLSRVWVMASVYEYELPFVREEQRATMTLSYLPGKTFEGRVSLIYPVLDAATRTAQVRLEFPNAGLVLKPDMYAEVLLETDRGVGITVPETAVIRTGVRNVVFVDKGEGAFEPREISIGLHLPDSYEVVAGLTEGERVLTSANFLVDSESKLKAALAAMAKDTPARHDQQ